MAQSRQNNNTDDLLSKANLTVKKEWLTSLAVFQQGLNELNKQFKQFESRHSDSQIHSLKTVIANNIVTVLNDVYPDNTWHAFGDIKDASVGSVYIKKQFLQKALEHDLFKHRHWTSLYSAINDGARYVKSYLSGEVASDNPAPFMPSRSQDVLLEALRAEKHKLYIDVVLQGDKAKPR